MFQSRVVASLRRKEGFSRVYNTLIQSNSSTVLRHEPVRSFSSQTAKKCLFGVYGYRSFSKVLFLSIPFLPPFSFIYRMFLFFILGVRPSFSNLYPHNLSYVGEMELNPFRI